MTSSNQLPAAVDEIIEGRSVTRSVHALSYNGADITDLFIERLLEHGYLPRAVGEIQISFGYRIPAFAIRKGTAYFGWVFVEKFSETKSRKMFGSILKNKKGDWAIQISYNSNETVYANPGDKSEMELEPSFTLE